MTLLAVVALTATACGTDGDDAEVITTDDEVLEDTDGEEDESADDPAESASAGVMNMSWGTPGGSVYDPHLTSNPFVYVFLYPAYDRLVNIDREGELSPMLAQSWEFSDDGMELVLELRDDVTFHDGEKFNADAVVANIERGLELEASTVVADLRTVANVEAVDEFTVRFQLTAPNAALPALLADRAGMMISPAAFDNDDLDLMPVGAGPYEAIDHEVGNRISYAAVDDYWDPAAQTLDELNIFMQLDSETRLNALRSGEINATWLNPDQIDDAEDAGLNVQVEDVTATFLMYINKSEGPLADRQVRQALMHAIDREGIAEALFEGNCQPTVQLFPEGYWAHNPDIGPEVYPYDPELAREMLADAGYPDGFEMSTVVVNVPFYVSQPEVLQAQFAEVGIELDVQVLEPAQLLSTFIGGESEGYYSQWPGAMDPAASVGSLLLEGSFLNPGGYTTETITSLHGQALATTDSAERADLYQEMMQEYVDEAFHLSVCSPPAIYAHSDAVDGISVDLKGMTDFRGATVN